MALITKLTKRLGISAPILQAPMSGTAGGALAGAVSAAGGMGLIGCGDPKSVSAEWIEREFSLAGGERVGCGFITWALRERPEALDIALARRPVAVMLSFGDPAPFAAPIRESGALLICQTQTVAQAREALEASADILVAQGAEAGGHGARRATLPLIPAIVDMVAATGRDIPVVAAGGVSDGRGLAASLMLGASGVLVGTRFHAAAESLLRDEAKRRIVSHGGDDTVRAKTFDVASGGRWPAEFDARTIDNPFARTWRGRETELANDAAALAAFRAARAAGDLDVAAVYAGEGIDLIHAIEPAGEIVARFVAEAEAALGQRFDRVASASDTSLTVAARDLG